MILDKFRRKCKENYKVESSQLYFKKSERGSQKKYDSDELDPWKLCIWTEQERNRILTLVHGSSTGIIYYIFIYLLCTDTKIKLNVQ